ncbi:aminotransferase, class V [sediment metagenome]|uniref:cysteine desulfurase n=1 Tax=sediment metagenome TaxID=749907 RepID=D9PK81_9ZZZZ
MKNIYLDHAATTPVAKEVLEEMMPYFSEKYGNASSLHSFGQEAKKGLEAAREKVAKLINADPEEIVFTSGGTESDNLALNGVGFQLLGSLRKEGKKPHIITTRIEHPAILEACKHLEETGYFDVTYLKVDRQGSVDPKEVEKAIRKETILVSVMHANNEIGTIEPIEEIAAVCRKRNVLFHTDAVQTLGKVPIDVKKMGIDLLSASSHKIYGPKGVGCLFVRRGVKLASQQHGGGHERGLRSGTENVAGIVGFGKACETAGKEMAKESAREKGLSDRLIKGVLAIPHTQLNGHPERRLPGNANFSFSFIEGESLLLRLDARGIAGSTGSACSTRKLAPSHVLTAIGMKIEETHGSLRLTLGRQNTKEDIDYAVKAIGEEVGALREMSPFKR